MNYHHLFYFWKVAKLGSIQAASKELRLSQPAISTQVRTLEESFEKKLFQKQGRGLKLTEDGHLTYRFAEDIFSKGQELIDTLDGQMLPRASHVNIGVAMVIPKLVALNLVECVLKLSENIVPICIEDNLSDLLARLSLHELDVVLSDSPIPPLMNIKAYNHLLGSCGVSFLATKKIKASLNGPFPQNLHRSPMLLPIEGTALRRALEQWFTQHKIEPKIIGEFEDSALLKAFGKKGYGIIPIADAIEKEVVTQFSVECIGRAPKIKESFYAISLERRIHHPAVSQIISQAKSLLFKKPR